MTSPVVEIAEGKVRGFVGENLDGNLYYSFLGIPYAKPPVGDLRFKAPESIEPWEGLWNATKNGNQCIQRDLLHSPDIQGCEDCLYLNIFTKNLPSEHSELKPVLVFIHGGAFQNGSNSTDNFGPEYLLTEDIVLVTPNYRVGILGFLILDDPSLEVPGNAGLKDQNLALQWVRKNVAKFNGDPKNVTLFGHSAGAISAHYHILSPASRGLFHKAILLSCSVFWIWTNREFSLQTFCDVLDIKLENEKDVLEALRSLPAEVLFAAQEKYLRIFVGKGLTFGPTVEKPNRTAFMTQDLVDIILNGEFSIVPLMASYTSNEGLIFEAIDRNLTASGVNIQDGPFRAEEILPPQLKAKMDKASFEMISHELENVYSVEDNTLKKCLLLSDAHFAAPTIAAAKTHAEFSENSVYLLRWSIEDELNAVKRNSLIEDLPGTCHGDELGYIFKMKSLPTPVKGTTAEKAVRRIVKLIKNFALHGNPTPWKEEFGLIWQPLQNNNSYVDFGVEITPKFNPEEERMRVWRKMLEFDKRRASIPNLKI